MKDEDEKSEFLSVKKVAEILDVTRRTVLNYIKYAGLPAKRFREHGPYHVARADLEQWIQTLSTKENATKENGRDG